MSIFVEHRMTHCLARVVSASFLLHMVSMTRFIIALSMMVTSVKVIAVTPSLLARVDVGESHIHTTSSISSRMVDEVGKEVDRVGRLPIHTTSSVSSLTVDEGGLGRLRMLKCIVRNGSVAAPPPHMSLSAIYL